MTELSVPAPSPKPTGRVFYRHVHEVLPELTDGPIASPVVRAGSDTPVFTGGDLEEPT